MSSTVYQGLQSCLEPRFIEPLVLTHKLVPPKSNSSSHTEEENKNSENENKNRNDNGELGGWSFIQSLTKPPQNSNEKVYVHPLLKRSSSTLSKQSLEMCTESLGSETGNHNSESSHEFPSLSSKSEKVSMIHGSKDRVFMKELTRARSFPPPLSSSDSVQVRPHRENGRLVIKAMTKASTSSYFQAERENGRLRLSLLKGKFYSDGEEGENISGDHNLWVGGEGKNSGKVGGEIEKGELAWPRRCKGGRGTEGISSWGPSWVATS